MLNLAGSAVLAFGFSLVLVPVCRRAARRFGFVAKPRSDRWHGKPTALLGGVAIALTVLGLHATLIGLRSLPVLFSAAAAMFAIGLVDDVVSLKPVTKLVLEVAVASFLVFFGYRLGWMTSLTLDTILTVFWIVGLTNAFNLLDNMDGLCAGLSIVTGVGTMAALLLGGISGPETIHLALLLGAAAGFLVYNFQPASIFMGDSGSLFLGLNLSVLTMTSPSQTHASTGMLTTMAAPALILMVPILDTTLVTVLRILSGRSAAEGGRDHSSHRLVAIGLSEKSAVLTLWALSALGGLLGVALQLYHGDLPSLVAAVFVLAVGIFAAYLSHVRIYEEDDEALQRREGLTPFVVDFVFRRRLAELFLDLCLTALAYYSAYRLRFGGQQFGAHFPQFLQSLPLVLGVQLLSLFATGAYFGAWHYFGLKDGITFAKGVGLGTLVNVGLLVYAYRFQEYSRGVFVIYAALLMLLLSGSRASFRLTRAVAHRHDSHALRVAIYGAGDVAASGARDILNRRHGGYRMLGFLVEDSSMARAQIQGYPVLGNFETLLGLVDEGCVDLVVLTQSIEVERLEELQSRCTDRGVSLEHLHFELDQLIVEA